MRRRLAIALSVSIVVLALAPGAGLARGPQKNDSVSGHGLVVVDPTITYEFRVSGRTVSDTTTVATGNMFLQLTQESGDPLLGTIVIRVWAEVYCVSTLAVLGEVRGHIYRSDGNVFDGLDLVFQVTDLSRVSDAPDRFTPEFVGPGVDCTEPLGGESDVDKGNITVHDESL